ncbi:DUF2020 domain-containing protein [Corynebacterium caspium]|uniref:DUF2020 domain-containing protein n=1 Tax=Corynebacterium caspium TaxID=234828 RepID=UPI000381DC57|nr:DUF2020 domain-containing protein [Corynebacterium caspium]WKD60011.1 hypothetical protein CCASP_08180 [Corynebacterium caspium DSM 44850]
MRRILPLACVALLAACTAAPPTAPEAAAPKANASTTASTTASETAPAYDSNLPLSAHPEPAGGRTGWEECPYLDTQWLADTNGQKVTGIGVDWRFDTPACVFWSFPPEPQAEIIFRHTATPAAAREIVDYFAPVADSSLAELPGGWSGGRLGATGNGSVFAVARENIALIVISNQEQSFKAEQIAQQALDAATAQGLLP